VYDIYSDAGNKDCQKGSYMGSVSVTCTDTDGIEPSTVTLGPVADDANCGPHTAHHYYIGCNVNPECTLPAFGAPKKADQQCTDSITGKLKCGGAVTTLGSAALVRTMPCKCGEVFWVLHQAG
jgi:hypothetical protein